MLWKPWPLRSCHSSVLMSIKMRVFPGENMGAGRVILAERARKTRLGLTGRRSIFLSLLREQKVGASETERLYFRFAVAWVFTGVTVNLWTGSVCSISLGLCIFRKQVIRLFRKEYVRIRKTKKWVDFEENELDAFFALQRIYCEMKLHLFLNNPLHCKPAEGQKNENSSRVGGRCI